MLNLRDDEGHRESLEWDSPYISWHTNEQKMTEETYKGDKLVFAKYWNSKGEEVETEEEAQK